MDFPPSLFLVSSSSSTLVGFVYRVFHTGSGCSYIGQTQQNPPSVRYKSHFQNSHSGAPKLQTSIKELGRAGFRAEVIETHRAPSHSELDMLLRTREAILIEKYDAIENGYNMTMHRPGNTQSDKALWKIITERRRKHPCNACPYRACSQAGLRVHKHKKHKGPAPFPCIWEGCGHRAATPQGLNRHKMMHTGEKPFPCTWEGCDYRAATPTRLKQHNRIHTNEKPFLCNWEGCEDRFNEKGSCKRHLRTHTREKPFLCTWEGCEDRFSHSTSLLRHKQTHTGEKPFPCTWEGCGYRAATLYSLKHHKRTHTNEKPFPCTWEGCNHRATQRAYLKKHVKRKHTQPKKSKKSGQPVMKKQKLL